MNPTNENNQKAGNAQSNNPRIIGGFEILNKIGAGAMGSVFKARQQSMDRIVALKILPPSIARDESYITRFQREARASAKLNHPNIVQGINVGQDEASGLWFFAMEYIDGPTLKTVLKNEKTLPEARVLAIGRDMALALACAEAHNIVHRDIKPDNILITARNESKLADLGLARQTGGNKEDAALTQDGKALGTPHYMSPEQVRGENNQIDIRTDIYALGATLYHLLSGRTPFEGGSSAEVMAKHLNDKPKLLHRLNNQVSEPLSRLIARMLAKDPAQRVPSATDLVKEFDDLIERQHTTALNQPIKGTGTTGPRAAVQRGTTKLRTPIGPRDEQKTPRRQPTSNRPVILGAAAGLLLLVGLAALLSSGEKPKDKIARPARVAQSKVRSEKTPPETKPNLSAISVPGESKEGKPATTAPAKDSEESKFSELVRFEGLKPEDTVGRIQRLEEFLADHAGSQYAAQAQARLTKLKEIEATQAEKRRQGEAKKRMEEQASAAFKRLSAFEGLNKNDFKRRKQGVEDFIKSHGQTQAGVRAKQLLTELQTALKALQPDPEQAAKNSEAAYAQFLQAYLELLRRNDREGASAHVQRALQDSALALLKARITRDQGVLAWLDHLDQDAAQGAQKLKDLERFELKMRRGKPMLVGKKEEFKVTDIKKGVIHVGRQGMSFPVSIERLHGDTRRELVALNAANDGDGLLRRALSIVFALNSPEDAVQAKSLLQQARKAGAVSSDVEHLLRWVEHAGTGMEKRASHTQKESTSSKENTPTLPTTPKAATNVARYAGQWLKLKIDGESPMGRVYAITAMLYDSKRKRCVLFGGGTKYAMWALDPAMQRWTPVQPNTKPDNLKPPPVKYHHFIYDEVHDRYWLNNGWSFDPKTKAWKNHNATLKKGQVSWPGIRQAWTYDPDLRRFVGARFKGFTDVPFIPWAVDIVNFKNSNLPTGKAAYRTYSDGGLAYDRKFKMFLLFGGYRHMGTVLNDTWFLAHGAKEWTEVKTKEAPPLRTWHRLIYHDKLEAIVLFGGIQKLTWLQDVWIFDAPALRWVEVNAPKAPSMNWTSSCYDAARDAIIFINKSGETWALKIFKSR